MKIYSDIELDNDIKYVKKIISRYNSTYKDFEKNFYSIKKDISSRISFIVSQFKNLFLNQKFA